MIALGGVQTFITESRTTADLAAASGIMSALAGVAARAAAGAGGTLVFPEHTDAGGVPNRVVLLTGEGGGRRVAEQAAGAVRDAWAGWVRREFGERAGAEPDTPGFPDVSWVCVPADRGDYETKWTLAQRALAARRGVRSFDAVHGTRPPCSLSPRWESSPPPPKARKHHRKEQLSRANWVKRQRGLAEDGSRFPSIYAISSARYRRAVDDNWDADGVAGAVRALHGAASRLSRQRETPVPGLVHESGDRLRGWLAESAGPWVYPDRWRPEAVRAEIDPDAPVSDFTGPAEQGRRAAADLVDRMRECGVAPPAIYLAVIAQDLDEMGAFLATRPVTVDGHRAASRQLIGLAGEQAAALRGRDLLGVPVYAGGDDLLAFAPAATALRAAAAVHALTEDASGLPKASTAVLFFHQHAQLRQVLVEVQRLLRDAKDRVQGKHALAVGYLRRSGVREESIQSWSPTPSGHSPETLFQFLGRHTEFSMSPQLVAVLERDAAELAELRGDVYEAELRRLVRRHASGGSRPEREQWAEQAAQALLDLGVRECSADGTGVRPAPVARVGVFLRQEAR